jgi:hypothetical protein
VTDQVRKARRGEQFGLLDLGNHAEERMRLAVERLPPDVAVGGQQDRPTHARTLGNELASGEKIIAT